MRLLNPLHFVLLSVLLIFAGSRAQAVPACVTLFKSSSLTQVEYAEALERAGAPKLVASRLAADFPEISDRILKRAAKGQIEWVTLYRGVSGTIESIDPHFYRVRPGGNLFAPPLRVSVVNGIFSAREIETAKAYAQMSLYSSAASDWGTGTVLELTLPRFLVTNFFFGNDYKYIGRANTPELDLWVTQYAEVPSIIRKLNDHLDDTIHWAPYEQYYFSEAREVRQPGAFARAMAKIYAIYNNLRG